MYAPASAIAKFRASLAHSRGRQIGGREFLWQGPWQLAAQPPGTVTARSNPPYATERGTLSYTLNFIIPAQLMFGWVFLDARVQTPSGANYTMSTSLDVGWRQTLWLGGIMVGYNGPANMAPNALNLTLPAPRSTICRIRLGKRC